MPFRTLFLLSSLRDKINQTSPINVKQSSFFRSHLLTIPSWSSSTKTKAKDMENILIFHVTLRIQILTMFSVQSKYSKKTKNILLLGFVISNKTCRTWNMQIQCQSSRLRSPSRWSKFTSSNAERPNGLISPQISESFTPLQDATLGVASARRAIGFLNHVRFVHHACGNYQNLWSLVNFSRCTYCKINTLERRWACMCQLVLWTRRCSSIALSEARVTLLCLRTFLCQEVKAPPFKLFERWSAALSEKWKKLPAQT